MVDQNLIIEIHLENSRDRRTNINYEITQKGENVIRYFKRAKNLLGVEEIANIPW
jgi:hypothetical protein